MNISRITPGLWVAGCFFALQWAHGAEVKSVKSCQEVAGFIASSGVLETPAAMSHTLQGLNCAAARNIPQSASLELIRTNWNASLQRWEFVLRCARRADCVPFLVWAQGENPHAQTHSQAQQVSAANSPANIAPNLVESGQTALLTWDGGGLRVVLPVTCLDAGSLGQTVRVRLKHVDRVLRAEVAGAGALTANL
jgi:Chaperone for flagella basal body P-ring formation